MELFSLSRSDDVPKPRLQKNLNVSKPSERPPHMAGRKNVKTCRWEHSRLQKQNLFMALQYVEYKYCTEDDAGTPILSITHMYGIYVWSSHTYSSVWINRVRLSILLVVSWTGKMNICLSPCVPENLVSRDGFSRPVPRQHAHSPYSG